MLRNTGYVRVRFILRYISNWFIDAYAAVTLSCLVYNVLPKCEPMHISFKILTAEVFGQHTTPFKKLPAGSNVISIRMVVVEHYV